MKKRIRRAFRPFLFLLCLLYVCSVFLCPFPTRLKASAETDAYAYVNGNDVYFYTTRDENRGLFLLPKTYFVKVLAIEDDFCKIEYLYDDAYYKKLTGYAKKEQLIFVDFTPVRPYLYQLVDLRYTIEGAPTDSSSLNQITITCAYYGEYKVGSQTYAYVLRNNEFGYVLKPPHLTVIENTEYLDRLQTPSTPSTPKDETMSPLQVGALIAVCLLVPTVVATLSKPDKRPTNYEEE